MKQFKKMLAVCTVLFAMTALYAAPPVAYAAKDLWYKGFVYAHDNNTVIPLETRFNIDFDKKNLYITVYCADPKAPQIATLKEGKKGAWPTMDSIEIFMDTERKLSNYHQIAAGVDKTLYDSQFTRKAWDARWTVAITYDKKSYTMKFTIPLKRPAKVGDVWGFNICRNVVWNGQYNSSWAKVGRRFHNPAEFGVLIFGSPQEANRARNKALYQQLEQLKKDLRTRGYTAHFAEDLKRLDKNCTDNGLRAIKDEVKILDIMKGVK